MKGPHVVRWVDGEYLKSFTTPRPDGQLGWLAVWTKSLREARRFDSEVEAQRFADIWNGHADVAEYGIRAHAHSALEN